MANALRPLAALFGALAGFRRDAFRRGWIASSRPARPVVVVGNIAVGGSGKTPVVAWLVTQLRARGHVPAIVSRGYGGTVRGVAAVPPSGEPQRFGDEPVMLARTADCPVYVGADRPAAIAALLAAHPECSVIVSDDGLQHYAMTRQIEIAVVDERVLGNQLLLPAGPLREPLERLREVDLVVLHGEASPALRASIGATPVFDMRLRPSRALRLDGGGAEPLAHWCGRSVHALAGIGRPERFFAMLREHGIAPLPHPFPDHHRFRAGELRFAPPAPILMTSKDAVKCRGLAPADSWEVPVEAVIDAGALDLILEKLSDGLPPARDSRVPDLQGQSGLPQG